LLSRELVNFKYSLRKYSFDTAVKRKKTYILQLFLKIKYYITIKYNIFKCKVNVKHYCWYQNIGVL